MTEPQHSHADAGFTLPSHTASATTGKRNGDKVQKRSRSHTLKAWDYGLSQAPHNLNSHYDDSRENWCALTRATCALARAPAPTTARLSAYVKASPRLSGAPESSEDDRLYTEAPTFIKNVATFITKHDGKHTALLGLHRLAIDRLAAAEA